MLRLLALVAAASPAAPRHDFAAHTVAHGAALAAAQQSPGLMTILIIGILVGGLVSLARVVRLAVSVMAELLQVAAALASTLFALVIFVVVMVALLTHRL